MRIADLRTGDLFIFDHELADCCAVDDAEVTDAGSVVLVYEHKREVQSRVFSPSVEVDLIDRKILSVGELSWGHGVSAAAGSGKEVIMRNTASEGALIKRINRKIGGYERKTCTAWGERLRKTRGDRWWLDLGSFYTVDWNTGNLRDRHIDLEEYGREVGALAEWEEVQP